MILFDKKEMHSINSLENYKDELQEAQGIYSLWYEDTCIYIGASNNLFNRLTTHANAKITQEIRSSRHYYKTHKMYEFIQRNRSGISFIVIKTADLYYEEELIKFYRPTFNVQGLVTPYIKPKIKQKGLNWA